MDASGNNNTSQGQLTPTGKNLCQILFGMADVENQGSVNIENIYQMVSQFGGLQATEEDKNIFIQRYAQGVQEIQLPKFEEIVKNFVMSDQVRKTAAVIMPLIDKNGDGFVDQEDLKEVYELLGFPVMDSMPLIQPFDTDKDGKLNAEEFANLIAESLKTLFSSREKDPSETAKVLDESYIAHQDE